GGRAAPVGEPGQRRGKQRLVGVPELPADRIGYRAVGRQSLVVVALAEGGAQAEADDRVDPALVARWREADGLAAGGRADAGRRPPWLQPLDQDLGGGAGARSGEPDDAIEAPGPRIAGECERPVGIRVGAVEFEPAHRPAREVVLAEGRSDLRRDRHEAPAVL